MLRKFSGTDIIGGKIANDNTARTLVLYVDGTLGVPGETETDDAFFRFVNSPAYPALFDYDTDIWKEGPEYLMDIFEESDQEE